MENDQISDFKMAFEIYDKDLDGYITKDDVLEIAKEIEFMLDNTKKQLVEKTEKIDLDTFLNIFNISDSSCSVTKDSIISAFQHYDNNNTGRILVAKFIQLMNEMSFNEDEIDEILKELDIDSNGYIDYKEWVNNVIKN